MTDPHELERELRREPPAAVDRPDTDVDAPEIEREVIRRTRIGGET